MIEPNCRTRGAMGRHRSLPPRPGHRKNLVNREIGTLCFLRTDTNSGTQLVFISPWLPASNSGRKSCGSSSLIWLMVLPVVASSTTSSTHRA